MKAEEEDKSKILMLALYVKCSYCGNFIDVKESHKAGISHGICSDCFEKEVEKHKRNERRN